MARLDTFLRNTGLFRARSEAKRACDAGQVLVGGLPARPSRELQEGEVVRIDTRSLLLEAEVLQVPERPVARARREDCYRVLRRERRTREEVIGFDDEL
ncbi:MAG: S4 domain-containing protein [Gemmatimonadota bacterium]